MFVFLSNNNKTPDNAPEFTMLCKFIPEENEAVILFAWPQSSALCPDVAT